MPTSYKTDHYDVPQFPIDAFVITPSAVDYTTTGYSDGITVLTTAAGGLTVVPLGNSTPIVFTGVPSYFTLPFRVRSVTASTAGAIGIG